MQLKYAFTVLLVASIGLTNCSADNAAAAPQAQAVVASGSFVAVSVPNMAAAKTWYMEKLGLTVLREIPKSNGIAVTILTGTGLIVELIERDDARAPGTPPQSPDQLHGFFKAGFLVANLDATLQDLRARGVAPAFGPFPAGSGQPANAIIRDVAGNLIQILAR